MAISTQQPSHDGRSTALLDAPLRRPAPATSRPRRISNAGVVALCTIAGFGLAALVPLFAPFPAGVIAIYCLVQFLHAERMRTRVLWRSLIAANALVALTGIAVHLFLR